MKTVSMFKTYLKLGSNHGLAIVYIAVLLVALLAFVGLVIDIGYMYVSKTELQNAADSAALAATSTLTRSTSGFNPNDLVQSTARTQAIAFAARNKATKVAIAIENDDSNTLGNDNDITVGHWNGSSYSANSTPVNAVQVRPRRTSDAPGGEVAIFLGRVFGINTMSAAADAIAALPPRATNFISLCTETCSGISNNPNAATVLDPPRVYSTRPGSPGLISFAWTSLLVHESSANEISPLICNDNPNEDVCGKNIYTTQGQVTSLIKTMESVFNNPNRDRANKDYDTNGKLIGWWVIVPVTEVCNPGVQPEPHPVIQYAWIRIISVCDTGGGSSNFCGGFKSTPCNNSGDIVIDRIACVNCADISNWPGMKPVLVE